MLLGVIVLGALSYFVATRGDDETTPDLVVPDPIGQRDDIVEEGPSGGAAPAFSGETLDGEQFDLADLEGRPYIVNFWASWCYPCRVEFPLLAEVADEGDIAVVGVVFKDLPDDARRFAETWGGDWVNVLDPDGEIARHWGVRSPPTTFFVDADGVVQTTAYGFTEASFERWVEELRAGS